MILLHRAGFLKRAGQAWTGPASNQIGAQKIGADFAFVAGLMTQRMPFIVAKLGREADRE
jgi:hypothetical protein